MLLYLFKYCFSQNLRQIYITKDICTFWVKTKMNTVSSKSTSLTGKLSSVWSLGDWVGKCWNTNLMTEASVPQTVLGFCPCDLSVPVLWFWWAECQFPL